MASFNKGITKRAKHAVVQGYFSLPCAVCTQVPVPASFLFQHRGDYYITGRVLFAVTQGPYTAMFEADLCHICAAFLSCL